MSVDHDSAESPFGTTPSSRTGLGSFISNSFRRDTVEGRTSAELSRGSQALRQASHAPAAADTSGSSSGPDVKLDVFEGLTAPLLHEDDDEHSSFAFPNLGDGNEHREASDQSTDGEPGPLPQSTETLLGGQFPGTTKLPNSALSRMHSNVSSGHASPAPSLRSRPSSAAARPQTETGSGSAGCGGGGHATAAMFGVINAVVCIPVTLSFATIIFQDPIYRPVLGELVKLLFLSCAIHQAVFAIKSTLPFAVGQVQDVGLIFLSAMASSVAVGGRALGLEFEEIIATMLFTLTISTIIVGLLIILTGCLRLAQLVQYVPLPVVGGYLGYVGYFCFVSGISLASGMHVATPASWAQLLTSPEALLKVAPAFATWLLLWQGTKYIRHPLALPGILCAIPVLFYIVLYATGLDLDDARDAGWVPKPQGEPVQFYEAWRLYDWKQFPAAVAWRLMLAQSGKLLALFFVVAFGSSMDVAAIQQNHPDPLDYNKELVTVGLANLATGMAGCGFTGSYIFSQTVFSQRMGVTSRVNGLAIVLVMLAMFLLPVDFIQYFPNLFFGGLMIWIGLDIAKDWLVLSYHKVRPVEFGLLWITFVLIWVLGLELGICAGIMLACMLFSYSYAKVHVHAFSVLPSRSGSVRTFEERSLLELLSKRITAVTLSGYIFFGSSIRISDKVAKVAEVLLASDEKVPRMRRTGRVPSAMDLNELQVSNLRGLNESVACLDGPARAHGHRAFAEAPRFMLLDLRRVNGLDATAAQTFSGLARNLHRMCIELVITHVPLSRPEVKRLLQAHGIIPVDGDTADPPASSCRFFPTMEQGTSYCEERLLEYASTWKLLSPPAKEMRLDEILRAHMEQPRLLLPATEQYEQMAAELLPYLTTLELQEGDVVFDLDEPSDELYFIQSGKIVCQMWYSAMRLRAPLHETEDERGWQREERNREFAFSCGGILGEMDFFLQRPRSFRAIAGAHSVVLALPRSAYEDMASRAPALLNTIQAIVLRSACLSLSHTVEVLEKADIEA